MFYIIYNISYIYYLCINELYNCEKSFNKMRVTLVKSFDEQPTLFSKCEVFMHEKWIYLDFQVINCFLPDSTEFTDALGKKPVFKYQEQTLNSVTDGRFMLSLTLHSSVFCVFFF